jgi:hypothetical protein
VDKGKINFLIDVLMFLCMAALAGIGFLMKYILIPGKEAWAKYGKKVDLSWLGLDRHDWGAAHLYLAFFLLALLVLHILLHWKMIIGLFHKYINQTNLRDEIAVVFVILCMVLMFFPFLLIRKLMTAHRVKEEAVARSSRVSISAHALPVIPL